MSESETKELPEQAGWYFLPRDDTPRYFDGEAFVYPNGARLTCSGGWSGPLVQASQLAALQATCERWSAAYARQADELVEALAEIHKAKLARDMSRHASAFAELDEVIRSLDGKVTELTARLAEVEADEHPTPHELNRRGD